MMGMTRSEIVCLLLGVVCIMQISAAPATDVREGNNNIVDEVIARLKQLRQQNEGMGVTVDEMQRSNINNYASNFGRPDEIMRVHRTLDPLGGGFLLKRDQFHDSLGGGYLLKRSSIHDPLGGGYLLKREPLMRNTGTLDTLGGGYLL